MTPPTYAIEDFHDIQAAGTGTWIHSGRLQFADRPELGVPAWYCSPGARLLSNRFWLSQVRPGTSAKVAAPAGRKVIKLELSNSDIAVSKMQRLVGISGANFAGSRWSASAMAFSLGHLLTHRISGPGTVYLESTSMSAELVVPDLHSRRSFAPNALVCFGADTEFRLTSGTSFWSLACGDWQLEVAHGWAVFDLGSVNDRGVGLIELLEKLYLPWR